MKLATLRNGRPDGVLVIVDRDLKHVLPASPVAATLQDALDRWDECEPMLRALAAQLDADPLASGAVPLDWDALLAPLPRAYQYLDGSAYPHHMSVIRQVRGASMPADFYDKPLMYQGHSHAFCPARAPFALPEDEALGVDVEAELAVITGRVPIGVRRDEAGRHIKLVTLLNDYSLRLLIPAEIARGFGFLQGKPASTLGPLAVTPDEFGAAWDGGMLSGRFDLHVRGQWLGSLDPGKDHVFDYRDLIAHAALTRTLAAGTVIGAGALANEERRHGNGCIAEARARETLALGRAETGYLRFGDRVRMEMFDDTGRSLFGAIDQVLERSAASAPDTGRSR